MVKKLKLSKAKVARPDPAWLAAFKARTDLAPYGDNALGLFALALRFGIEDLVTVAADAIIRQALPQLLEYAFWPEEERADELIVVSQLPPTKAAERYVAHLRKRFGLPLTYRHFDLKTNSLK